MPIINSIHDACEKLKQSQVIGMPTETVYGLAADATSDSAVASIYEIKQRPTFHPLISHVSSVEMAESIGLVDPVVLNSLWIEKALSLTVVVPRKANSALSWLATAGLETVAIRLPQHAMARELIDTYGKPLAAPSANPFGSLSPVSATHVAKAFLQVDVLDGGDCEVGLESTIVDLTQEKPVLLRLGAVERSILQEIWPDLIDSKGYAQAPGTHKKHYQPKTQLFINALNAEPDGAFVGFGSCDDCTVNLSESGSLKEAASRLFSVLHDLDERGYAYISIAPIPDEGLGEAINDRLKRAAEI